MLRFVVLGDPVEHSLSPRIHRSALAALGLAGAYEARRVDGDGMAAAADEIRRGDLDGANITMPHKRLARRLADVVGPDAARAGSVNTWYRDGHLLVGESTDVAGMRVAWERRCLPAGGPALVLGSGGAAAAALVALAGHPLAVSARRPEAAADLAAACGVAAAPIPWGTPVPGAVVVNCTPVGMGGEELPAAVVAGMGGAFDLAYGGAETPLVASARRAGLPVADGIDHLVAQAEESFVLWTDRRPPPGVMEEAARNLSSREEGRPKDVRTRG